MESAKLGYVPALDGVRAVAIVSVVSYHAWGWPSAGSGGVSVFFLLSGFLITTLLLEERRDHGAIALRSFYARRARRLLPALAVMLAAVVVIAIAKGDAAFGLRSVAEGGLYSQNILMAFFPGVTSFSNPVEPLWSLAQEEQFYLVWPLLLIVGLRRIRLQTLEKIIRGVAVALVIECLYLVAVGAASARIYYAPDTRSLELLVGALVAFALWQSPPPGDRFSAGIGLGLILLTEVAFDGPNAHALEVVPLTVGAMLLVIGVVQHRATRTSRLLSTPALVFVGKISYSLYLWNQLLLWALNRHHSTVAVALAFGVSVLSYRFVERPFRRRRAGHRYGADLLPAHGPSHVAASSTH